VSLWFHWSHPRVSYQSRGGRIRTQQSASTEMWALDAKIAGRSPAFAAGVVVGFYADRGKAEKAAAEINSGGVADWSDAVIVVAAKASA
jgi:hypothetical protein